MWSTNGIQGFGTPTRNEIPDVIPFAGEGNDDLDKCIKLMHDCGADFFARKSDEGYQIVCYSPYYLYDNEGKELRVLNYVYHWVDTYDEQGNFIKHEAFESTFTTELDYDI